MTAGGDARGETDLGGRGGFNAVSNLNFSAFTGDHEALAFALWLQTCRDGLDGCASACHLDCAKEQKPKGNDTKSLTIKNKEGKYKDNMKMHQNKTKGNEQKACHNNCANTIGEKNEAIWTEQSKLTWKQQKKLRDNWNQIQMAENL